jgi:uncharacterized membrane protein YbaN (DUF454 family)
VTALENAVSAGIAALGALAVGTGIVGLQVAPVVLGATLVLAALWFRRSLRRIAEIEANTREAVRALALLARLQQRGGGPREPAHPDPVPGPGTES